jgi:hypothetical protein
MSVTARSQRESAPKTEEPPAVFHGLLRELEEIGRRARETRVKLAHGDATSGATALLEIEHRCLDALAAIDPTGSHFRLLQHETDSAGERSRGREPAATTRMP